MRASVKITKVDPRKKYLGKLVYDAEIEGIKIAIYMNMIGDISVEFNDDPNERYTAEPKAIIAGVVTAGCRKLIRERNREILKNHRIQMEQKKSG